MDTEKILDINVRIDPNGEISSAIGFSKRFFMQLKEDVLDRELFLGELFEKLNKYIDEVKDGE